MVEDQQGIKTVLSFGTKSVDPKLLEQLLVGRERSAKDLFLTLKAIAQNKNNQQLLIVGERGMGKTHLLRILYEKSKVFIESGQLVVAYFSEEEYGIASYFDFLVRILNSVIRSNERDANFLKLKLEELQGVPHPAQPRFLEKIIQSYVGDRQLLILVENFVDILDSMGHNGQGNLRAWMYTFCQTSIIGTTQRVGVIFDSIERPFFCFFLFDYLEPLSLEESERFLIQLAALDGRPDVVDHLRHRGKAQVRAIHELLKGNHRLLVTFYEFLKTDTPGSLSNHLIKLINSLKPYYETYIRYLPPQQQKILHYIALAGTPQQGTVISKNCFIDQTSLSKQLSELVKKELVEIVPDQVDKRNKLYDIKEPLLRMSIEVGEHKGGRNVLFVDFLALYHDKEDLKARKKRISDLMTKSDKLLEQLNFEYEIKAIERALELKKKKPAGDIKPIVIDWVTNILAGERMKLSKSELDRLRGYLAEVRADVPELQITLSYIDVFEEYFLNKNKNAVYELPKEQRLFFEKHILGE